MKLDLDWETCQHQSDHLLAEGLAFLCKEGAVKADEVVSGAAGNYLVSRSGTACYAGEAKNLAKRIRQQFVEKTSTFYKSYLRTVTDRSLIREFQVQHIETLLGRKELEEFAIVNAGCVLNRFQLGKRDKFAVALSTKQWCEVQTRYEQLILQGSAAALSATFRPWSDASAGKCAGLYLVRAPTNDEVLYIGESSNVCKRYECHRSRTYFSALRRHVGTELFGFSLQSRNGKAKYFSDDEDREVTTFLNSCRVGCLAVSLGRFELEEYLIRTLHPRLNRKDNVAGAPE